MFVYSPRQGIITDVTRQLTVVASKIFPCANICAFYCLMFLVVYFYVVELHIGVALPSSSVLRVGVCNWWSVITQEVGLFSDFSTLVRVFFRRFDHRVLYIPVSEHLSKSMAKNLSYAILSKFVVFLSALSTLSNH